MLRYAVVAAVLALGTAAPALAQGYPPEPPRNYYAKPPGTWAHQGSWEHMNHEQQQAYFDQWRHERWRCDHGDHAACHWVDQHGRG